MVHSDRTPICPTSQRVGHDPERLSMHTHRYHTELVLLITFVLSFNVMTQNLSITKYMENMAESLTIKYNSG